MVLRHASILILFFVAFLTTKFSFHVSRCSPRVFVVDLSKFIITLVSRPKECRRCDSAIGLIFFCAEMEELVW